MRSNRDLYVTNSQIFRDADDGEIDVEEEYKNLEKEGRVEVTY